VSPDAIMTFLVEAASWALPVLIAITFHEAAHAYAAHILGDDTAKRLGRVSFNPLRHVDLFGTILLPALLLITRAPFLFGWAKPVPVMVARLKNPRRDMMLVALAGPAANLILALLSALLMNLAWLLPEGADLWSTQMLYRSILINLVLAIFNMLPIPPLDGGRVATGLLPINLARSFARLERCGLLIVIGLFLVLPFLGREAGLEVNPFHWLIAVPLGWLMPAFLALANIG